MPDRGALNHAFLFELPTGYTEGAVSLTAVLNPEIPGVRERSPVEATYANNDLTVEVVFEPVPEMQLVIYRVGYRLGEATYAPSQAERERETS